MIIKIFYGKEIIANNKQCARNREAIRISSYTFHEPALDLKEMMEKCKSDKGPLTYYHNYKKEYAVDLSLNKATTIIAIKKMIEFLRQVTEADLTWKAKGMKLVEIANAE